MTQLYWQVYNNLEQDFLLLVSDNFIHTPCPVECRTHS